jgi:uncharacterized protein
MTPISDIQTLLKSMSPTLNHGAYVFVTSPMALNLLPNDVIMSFQESEGMTYIIPKNVADDLALCYDFVAAWITLEVHSALEAVGLTAAFAKALGDAAISCNVVAAYYHDHIFVPYEDKDRAVDVLKKLSRFN